MQILAHRAWVLTEMDMKMMWIIYYGLHSHTISTQLKTNKSFWIKMFSALSITIIETPYEDYRRVGESVQSSTNTFLLLIFLWICHQFVYYRRQMYPSACLYGAKRKNPKEEQKTLKHHHKIRFLQIFPDWKREWVNLLCILWHGAGTFWLFQNHMGKFKTPAKYQRTLIWQMFYMLSSLSPIPVFIFASLCKTLSFQKRNEVCCLLPCGRSSRGLTASLVNPAHSALIPAIGSTRHRPAHWWTL